MDEDIDYETTLDYPILYKSLLKGRLLNTKSFIILVIKALIQGTLIMYLTTLLFPRSFYDIVTIQFTALIITELLNTMTIVSSFYLNLILITLTRQAELLFYK